MITHIFLLERELVTKVDAGVFLAFENMQWVEEYLNSTFIHRSYYSSSSVLSPARRCYYCELTSGGEERPR